MIDRISLLLITVKMSNTHTIKGFVLLLSSSVSFAVSTVFAKLVTENSEIQAIEITFFRFFFGFIIVSLFILRKKKSLKPVSAKYISLRAVFNTVAVICFFVGIQYTTVSKANMLNFTSPVFVFLISPFLNHEKISPVNILYLIITMAGIYLVVTQKAGVIDFSTINKGDALSLFSGILAGFALSSLREARKYDPSYRILFYLMATGSIINLIIVIPVFLFPKGMILLYTALSTITSLLGQLFITTGYRYISAAAGSLVSSSRLVFAFIMGIIIFGDPITQRMALGTALIIISLTGVSGIRKRLKKRN